MDTVPNVNKRKSTALRKRITEVFDVKVRETEQKALAERVTKAGIEGVINKTIVHLKSKGFVVAKLTLPLQCSPIGLF